MMGSAMTVGGIVSSGKTEGMGGQQKDEGVMVGNGKMGGWVFYRKMGRGNGKSWVDSGQWKDMGDGGQHEHGVSNVCESLVIKVQRFQPPLQVFEHDTRTSKSLRTQLNTSKSWLISLSLNVRETLF